MTEHSGVWAGVVLMLFFAAILCAGWLLLRSWCIRRGPWQALEPSRRGETRMDEHHKNLLAGVLFVLCCVATLLGFLLVLRLVQ